MNLFSTHNYGTRTSLLIKNVVVSFFIKGWSAIVVLLMVPLTLDCLGAYQNGVWLTISSLLVWIDQMDIGLGNGLRNRLAMFQARGESDEAQKIVSSTMAMLVCIIIPLFLVFSAIIWLGNIYAFLNVDPNSIPELQTALQCAVTLVCITFVLKFIGNVYMGMQLPAVSNLLMALGQTIALIATWLLFLSHHATFYNIVAVNTAAPMLVYLSAYPITFYWKYPLLRPRVKSVNLRTAVQLDDLSDIMEQCCHGKLFAVIVRDITVDQALGVLCIDIIHQLHAVAFHMPRVVGIVGCLGVDGRRKALHEAAQLFIHLLDQDHVGQGIGHLRGKGHHGPLTVLAEGDHVPVFIQAVIEHHHAQDLFTCHIDGTDQNGPGAVMVPRVKFLDRAHLKALDFVDVFYIKKLTLMIGIGEDIGITVFRDLHVCLGCGLMLLRIQGTVHIQKMHETVRLVIHHI